MKRKPEADNTDTPPEVRLVPTSEAIGARIDRFLSGHLSDLSRTRIQTLIEEGCVRSNLGPIDKCNAKLRGEEWIEVRLPTPLAAAIAPENLPIKVLFEDKDLAVVFKPAGMPTHPTTTKTSGTLVNALLYHLGDLSEIGGVLRPGIVHRLDRVTSGLLVVAKNQKTHRALTDQFRSRNVEKTYRALCLGADPGSRGSIQGFIARHPHKGKRMILGETGRDSLSEYERIASAHPLYGLLVKPKSGRTHQIRVHLERLGCPIVLDTLYAYEPKRWPVPELNPLLKGYPGILLHAERLAFEHPCGGGRKEYCARAPETFAALWERVFHEKI